MMNTKDEAILKWVPDYRINLIELSAIRPEDMDKFQSDLGAVLKFIKYSWDKDKMAELVKNDSAYQSMDKTGAQLLKSCAKLDIKIEEREEKINMCQAIQEINMLPSPFQWTRLRLLLPRQNLKTGFSLI